MAKRTLSTGIIPTNYSRDKIKVLLSERASARGWKPNFSTLEISTPRKGMKVAVCECEDAR